MKPFPLAAGARVASLTLIACLISLTACSNKGPPDSSTPAAAIASQEAQSAREQQAAGAAPVTNLATENLAATAIANPARFPATAQVGILYFLDRPNHREALLATLQSLSAELVYESPKLGLLVARLSWENTAKLLDKKGDLGLAETSLLKVELDETPITAPFIPTEAKNFRAPKPKSRKLAQVSAPERLRISGPVHSAGFGAKIDEFRRIIGARWQKAPNELAGQGISIAVYDSGFEAQNVDIVAGRVLDILPSDGRSWMAVEKTAADFFSDGKFPAELIALQNNASARFLKIDNMKALNDSSANGEFGEISFALAQIEGNRLALWVKATPTQPFRGPYFDFSLARAENLPTIISMTNGSPWQAGVSRGKAAWIKLRKRGEILELSLQGMPVDGDHGSSNLQMAAGLRQLDPTLEPLRGVASAANVLLVQPWAPGTYGQNWVPLAIGISEAVERGADVLNLDIYTPGSRTNEDLLNRLLCRVATFSDSVAVIAAHNYGPLSNTVQNLAQSPCVITVGASISQAAAREGYETGPISPDLTNPTDVYTANYSGRGFGYFGTFKPDIISPAYAYTPAGSRMDRFGGTSGATPATAGAIALLKQAAKLAGQTLNYAQVRFILQAGSKAPPADRLFDGYGYLDMEKTAEILLKHFDAPPERKISPLLVMNGPWNTLLRFNSKVMDQQKELNLRRADSLTERMDMTFSVQGDAGWVSLNHGASGNGVRSLNMDLEPAVQNTSLGVRIFPGNSWDQLPPGITTAYIAGVRKNLQVDYGPRAADLLIPIMVEKGIEFGGQARIEIPPTLVAEPRRVLLKTNPGEVITLTGSVLCSANRNTPVAFALVHRESAPKLHSSLESNFYSPLTFSGTPLTFNVDSPVSEFVFYRNRSQNCPGPISGELVFSRSEVVQVNAEETRVTHPDGKNKVTFFPNIRNESKNYSDVTDDFELLEDQSEIVVTREITGQIRFEAGELLKSFGITGDQSQGVLHTFDPSGTNRSGVARSSSRLAIYTQGEQTPTETYFANEIPSGKAGQIFEFLPLNPRTPYTVKLRFRKPANWQVTFSDDAPIKVEVTYPDRTAFALPPEWAPEAHWEYAAHLRLNRRGASSDRRTVWERVYRIPLP